MTDLVAASPDDDTIDYDALPRRTWSGKRVMLVALPALALLVAGYFAWTRFQTSKPVAENAAALETAYVKLPDMFVNLSSGPGRARFLKLGVTLEVKGEERAASIKKRMPRIVDSFQIYLRELRLEDLNGSAGTFLLKEELLRRVNTEIAPDRVEDVLFEEMMTHEQ
jgi:flagellar protein FliL